MIIYSSNDIYYKKQIRKMQLMVVSLLIGYFNKISSQKTKLKIIFRQIFLLVLYFTNH